MEGVKYMLFSFIPPIKPWFQETSFHGFLLDECNHLPLSFVISRWRVGDFFIFIFRKLYLHDLFTGIAKLLYIKYYRLK